MKTRIFLILMLFCSRAYADVGAPLNVEEVDGSPSAYPYKIKVSNGSLTNNGDGTVTIASGSVASSGTVSDDAIVRFNGTSGNSIQNSECTITDQGVLTCYGVTSQINFRDNGYTINGDNDSKLRFASTGYGNFYIDLESVANQAVVTSDSTAPVNTFTYGGMTVKADGVSTTRINDFSGSRALTIVGASTPVNYLTITNAATGSQPNLSATGTDSDIPVKITPKGESGLSISTSATHKQSTITAGLMVNSAATGNAADDFQVKGDTDNNTLYVRVSSDNVGIGIASPLRKLHIVDVMRLEPRASVPSSASSGDIYVDSSPTPDELCFYDGAGWQGLSSGTDANCA